ncbi:MAG: aminoglycoside phosphotransferase family protein [Clostridia bacterium]|nr:aminoglycoside phosphotransferase family protein [Clostridia bacterium]
MIDFYLKHFDLKVNEVINVPESFSSTVYLLLLQNNKKVILKIPYNQVKLQRELFVLETLKGKIKVPEVIDYFEGDSVHSGAMVLSYLDGKPITGAIDEALAYDMGVLLGHLHEVKMPHFTLEKDNDKWWESVEIRFNEWAKECQPVLEPDFFEQCMITFKKLYRDLPHADGPSLIHFDFRPGNILVKENKIVGLIDFESSRGGSTDIDFTKVKVYVWDLYSHTKEAFIKGYESVRVLPPIDKTLPLYLFFNGFGGLAWCARRNKLEDEFFIENYEQVKAFFD